MCTKATMRPSSTRRRNLQILPLRTMLAERFGRQTERNSTRGNFNLTQGEEREESTGGAQGWERWATEDVGGAGRGVHRSVWTVCTLWAHHHWAHPLQTPPATVG